MRGSVVVSRREKREEEQVVAAGENATVDAPNFGEGD
jgi:hypothetical protein